MSSRTERRIIWAIKALISAIASLEMEEEIEDGDWEVLNDFVEEVG